MFPIIDLFQFDFDSECAKHLHILNIPYMVYNKNNQTQEIPYAGYSIKQITTYTS